MVFVRSSRYFAVLAVLLCAAVMLSACGTYLGKAVTAHTAYNIFKDPDVNLRAKSAAAADYMVDRSGNYLPKDMVIKAVSLTQTDQPSLETPFGHLVPYQVGLRLHELGYTVDLSDVAAETGGIQAAAPLNPVFALSGAYTRRKFNPSRFDFSKPEVDVTLHIINVKTGRLVSTFEYTMPVNRKIAKMTDPEARIFRVSPVTSE